MTNPDWIYSIKLRDPTLSFTQRWVEREPVVGQWYAGGNIIGDGQFIFGAMATYIGEGRFVDDDGLPVDMSFDEFEFLVELPGNPHDRHDPEY